MLRPLGSAAAGSVTSHATTAPTASGGAPPDVVDHSLGRYEAWLDVVGVDATITELQRENAGDPVQRALANPIAEPPATIAGGRCGVVIRGPRGDVHKATGSSLEHAGQKFLRECQRRHDVGFQMHVQQFEGCVDESIHVARTDVSAVVDQHIDRPPFPEDPVGGGFDRRAVGEVCGDHQGFRSGLLDRLRGHFERARQRARVGTAQGGGMFAALALLERAGYERDVESGSCEMHGDGLADSTAGPGYHGSGHTRSLEHI
jgi:hypothetical protein